MAFTETELLSIVRIVGISPSLLDAQIVSLGADLTVDVESAVRDEITRWEDAGGKFVKIHPKESNFGVETDAGDAKADIRRNIAILLGLMDYLAVYKTMGTLQIG